MYRDKPTRQFVHLEVEEVMTTSARVDMSRFESVLKPQLGPLWGRALTIFEGYGPALSWCVTKSLDLAVDRGKVEEVLGILERHYRDHLSFQHPDIRGAIEGASGDLTNTMFRQIFEVVLKKAPCAG